LVILGKEPRRVKNGNSGEGREEVEGAAAMTQWEFKTRQNGPIRKAFEHKLTNQRRKTNGIGGEGFRYQLRPDELGEKEATRS